MKRLKTILTTTAALAFIALAVEVAEATGEDLHAALHERYSVENTIRTWYEIYNEHVGENVSRETYEKEIFCSDEYRLTYINWIIPTSAVPLIVKLHVLEGMRDAEAELCFIGS